MLPSSTVAPISAETRLAYVLRHFRMAFPAAPTHVVGYAGNQLPVTVADGAGAFFAQAQPYPAAPHYRDWLGKAIPFFFDSTPEKPLLELLPDGRAIIHTDIIAAAFYLLSGWQEFFSEERDRHGRFPYAASVQHRYDFVTLPVVNYYFDVLKTAIEHATGRIITPKTWANAPFAAFITHDIDNLQSAWKQPAKAALKAGKLLDFGRQLWQHFTQADAWDNLALVQQTVAGYGAKSTFFFLPEHRPAANGTPNADYRIKQVWLQMKELAATGAEIGLHGSLLVSGAGRLHEEAELVADGAQGLGLRFHYLRWEPRTTPALLGQTELAYDTTLGFAEHFGFRNSYCLPFHPFNFEHSQAYDFLEIPLNVMDATLYHPNYLQLAPDEILPAVRPMVEEIERFGGVCTVLWHNENFDPANQHNGPQQFHVLMEYLRSRRVAFVNGTDICATMS